MAFNSLVSTKIKMNSGRDLTAVRCRLNAALCSLLKQGGAYGALKFT
jgi:hypothetical protein